MRKIYISFVLTVVIIFGCNKEIDTDKSLNKQSTSGENEFIESLLYHGPTKYSIITKTDYPLMGYGSFRENPLADDLLMPVIQGCLCEDGSKGKSGIEEIQTITVNGINLDNLKNYSDTENKNAITEQLFGQEVVFSVSKTQLQNKTSDPLSPSGTQVSMYIPEKVQILSPNIVQDNQLLPFCYYKGFVLKWNEDTKNENGVVIVVEWTGATSYGKHFAKHVRNIDIVPIDNGETVLNDKLFDNIPEFGIVFLTLIRGNVELGSIKDDNHTDEELIRLAAATQAGLPLILIRNL